MKTPNPHKLFMQYLGGNMPPDEKKAFDEKLNTSEELSDELVSFVVKKYEEERLRSEIKSAQLKGKRLAFRPVLKWAAVILIFLLPAGYLVQQYYQNSKSLNSDYYLNYPAQTGLRGNANIPQAEIIAEAFQFYANKDFEEASQLFLQAMDLPDLTNKNKYQLYTGISLLRTEKRENYQLASENFKEVLATRNEFNQAAEWFLAICLFESGDLETSKTLLKKIAANQNHFRRQKAMEVLEEKF